MSIAQNSIYIKKEENYYLELFVIINILYNFELYQLIGDLD